MHKNSMLLVAGAFAFVAACSKTDNGDVVVQKPVGVDVKTATDTLHPPTVGMQKDTINTPVMGTKAETVVVQKPVVGTKKTEVNVPVLKKRP
jgi:hypothetical protein